MSPFKVSWSCVKALAFLLRDVVHNLLLFFVYGFTSVNCHDSHQVIGSPLELHEAFYGVLNIHLLTVILFILLYVC